MAPKHILIIEDEPALRHLLEKKLKDEGYRVTTAEDGKQGLDQIASERPDLVLLDIMMPTLDGFGVLDDLQKRGITPDLPIVIISNSGQPVEIDRAKRLGIRDYLVKADFTPQEVLDKVVAQIGKSMEEAQDAPSSESAAMQSASAEQAQAPVTSAVSGGGKIFDRHVLLVEDDKFLRNLLSRKLQIEGFKNVDTAETGSEALTKIKSTNPELVLLDLILPDVSGFEILEIVKGDEQTKHIPIIVLSNLGQKEELDRCKELGAEEFLIKANFSTKDIADRIRKFFGDA